MEGRSLGDHVHGNRHWRKKAGLDSVFFFFLLKERSCDQTDAFVLLLLTSSNVSIYKAAETKPLTSFTLFSRKWWKK